MDALAPGLAFFMIMIGVSHLLSGNAYGAPTRVPWAVYLWSDYRQPTQLYEIFFALVVFMIVLSRMIPANAPGLRFVQFLSLSAIARVFIEAFRGDSAILFDGYRAAQVIGLAILIVCLALLRSWEGKGWNVQIKNRMKTLHSRAQFSLAHAALRFRFSNGSCVKKPSSAN